MPQRKQPAIPDELLDQLLGGSDPRAALAAPRRQPGRAAGPGYAHHRRASAPTSRTLSGILFRSNFNSILDFRRAHQQHTRKTA